MQPSLKSVAVMLLFLTTVRVDCHNNATTPVGGLSKTPGSLGQSPNTPTTLYEKHHLHRTGSRESFDFPGVIHQFSINCGCSYKFIPETQGGGMLITVQKHDRIVTPAEPGEWEGEGEEIVPNVDDACFVRSIVVPTSWILTSPVLQSLAEYLTRTPLPEGVSWVIKFEPEGGTTLSTDASLAIQLYVHSAVSWSFRRCQELGNGMASVIINEMEADPGPEEGWVPSAGETSNFWRGHFSV
ncbi:hypothetical protein B0H11DRAFT_2416150 [Mycena galericulata]|nr:hypothetical protein B0H11DRAFT_2416150 [Mycena galericulata]